MLKKIRQKRNYPLVPFNIVTAVILGVVFLLFTYLYVNYFSSETMAHASGIAWHDIGPDIHS
ncbi:hypothetical protein ACLHDD_18455 [Pantoea sp. NSTU24]|uniref:hypothetical protein n=1 Tax=Pantoea sp. NSTU24 TaxID=3391144 RepID=UPI003CFFAC2B